MNNQWQGDLPIYKQLAEKLKTAILEETFVEGDALPSVRVICSELNINHITVSKALHELVAEGLIEKKRGLGMFVVQGAVKTLQQTQKQQFIQSDLPELMLKIKRLGIERKQLIEWITKQGEYEND